MHVGVMALLMVILVLGATPLQRLPARSAGSRRFN